MFVNIVIPLDWVNETNIIIKLVKKDEISFLFINEIDDKDFDFIQIMSQEFDFQPH